MSTPLKVFCCSAHEDQEMLEHLKRHLMPLQRRSQITIWSDANLTAGVEWEKELHQHLESADMILLLLSPDFMASDHCYSTVMGRAIVRHNDGSAQVIPLLLRPVHWDDAPFAQLQVIPTNAEPVTKWVNRDDAFHDTVKHINRVITDIKIQRALLEAGEHTKAIRYQEALACYEHVLHLDRANGSALFGKARTLFLLGRVDASIEAFTLAEQIAPAKGENFFSQHFKARAFSQKERYAESLIAYDRVVSLDPDNADIYSERATILIKQQAYEQALSALEQARHLKPESVEYITQTGDLLFRLRRYRQALAMYEQAGILQPEEAKHQEQQGRVLTYLQRYEDAVSAYQKALAIFPQAQYFDQIGKIFLKQARNQEALKIYEQAIQITTEGHFPLYVGKGYALLQLEQYDEALACYQSAVKLNELEVSPQFYHDLGTLYERLAQYSYAMERKQPAVGQSGEEEAMFFFPTTLNPTTMTLLHTLNGHKREVTSLAFSPDGKTLISGSHDSIIRFWEVPSGRVLRALHVHENAIYGLAVSLDGKTVAIGSGDPAIRLWDLSSGRLRDTLIGHKTYVPSLAISPDAGTLASGSYDRTIKLWKLADRTYGYLLRDLTGHTEGVQSIVFSPDGRFLASGSQDCTIKLWELSAGVLLTNLTGHTGGVLSVAISSNGHFLASGSEDHTIKLWEFISMSYVYELRTLTNHTDIVLSVAFSPDGNFLASGSADHNIKIWELPSGRELCTLTGHTSSVNHVAFSPDGQILASGSQDHSIKLWGMEL